MGDVIFLKDGKAIPAEQVVVESMRAPTTTVALTTRERWLMLQSFWAGVVALEASQEMNEPMINFDDWLKTDMAEKITVEMTLIQRAPPK